MSIQPATAITTATNEHYHYFVFFLYLWKYGQLFRTKAYQIGPLRQPLFYINAHIIFMSHQKMFFFLLRGSYFALFVSIMWSRNSQNFVLSAIEKWEFFSSNKRMIFVLIESVHQPLLLVGPFSMEATDKFGKLLFKMVPFHRRELNNNRNYYFSEQIIVWRLNENRFSYGPMIIFNRDHSCV